MLESCGVVPGLLFHGEQPDIDAQQSLGDFILEFMADLVTFIFLRRQHSPGDRSLRAGVNERPGERANAAVPGRRGLRQRCERC